MNIAFEDCIGHMHNSFWNRDSIVVCCVYRLRTL